MFEVNNKIKLNKSLLTSDYMMRIANYSGGKLTPQMIEVGIYDLNGEDKEVLDILLNVDKIRGKNIREKIWVKAMELLYFTKHMGFKAIYLRENLPLFDTIKDAFLNNGIALAISKKKWQKGAEILNYNFYSFNGMYDIELFRIIEPVKRSLMIVSKIVKTENGVMIVGDTDESDISMRVNYNIFVSINELVDIIISQLQKYDFTEVKIDGLSDIDIRSLVIAIVENDEIGLVPEKKYKLQQYLNYYSDEILSFQILNSIRVQLANKNKFDLAIKYENKIMELYNSLTEDKRYFIDSINSMEFVDKDIKFPISYNYIHMYKSLAVYYTLIGEIDKAIEVYHDLQEKMGKEPKQTKQTIASVLNNIAGIYAYLEKYDIAIDYCNKIISMDDIKPKTKIRAYHNLSNIYRVLNKYELSIEYLRSTFELSKKLHIIPNQVKSKLAIAEIYMIKGDLNRANSELKIAYELSEKSGINLFRLLTIYYQIQILEVQGHNDFNIYKKQLVNKTLLSVTEELIIYTLINLKILYHSQSNNSENLYILEENLTYLSKILPKSNIPIVYILDAYIQILRSLVKLGDVEYIIDMANEFNKYCEKVNIPPLIKKTENFCESIKESNDITHISEQFNTIFNEELNSLIIYSYNKIV